MLGPPSVLRALVRKEPRSEVLSALTTARVPARCWAGVAFGAFFLASSASMAALIVLYFFAVFFFVAMVGLSLGLEGFRVRTGGRRRRSSPGGRASRRCVAGWPAPCQRGPAGRRS